MTIFRHSTLASLSIAAAIFSMSAMAAQPAPPGQSPTPPPSTTPASPQPESPKPFFEADPADKPKPIEINPQDLQTRQPASIKSAK